MQKDVSTFEKLLFCDTFRGPHSTGVFSRRSLFVGSEKLVSIPYYKEAIEGPEFLETSGWQDIKSGLGTIHSASCFYVGHNRYATTGEINAVNAHPFKIGDITLVHNGTLIDQTLLPDHNKFEVDSENICHSINEIGAAETIQKLDGAFVLVWHDAKDDTLHIVRNSERPFHLAKTSTGDWFGASEEEMLMWILNRGRSSYTISDHFECKVGVEYVFNTDGVFTLTEQIEHKLPSFASKFWDPYSDYSDYYTQRYNNTNRRALPSSQTRTGPITSNEGKVNKVNELLRDVGLNVKMGGLLSFTTFEFIPYAGNERDPAGKVNGYLDMNTLYVETQIHNVKRSEYEQYQDMTGKIVGAYDDKGVTVIVLHTIPDKKEGNSSNNIVPFVIKEADIFINGEYVSKEEWERCDQCINCLERIPFEDVLDEVTWFQGEAVCLGCKDIVEGIMCDSPYEEMPLVEKSATCKNCMVELDEGSSSIVLGICQQCLSWLEEEEEYARSQKALH